MLRHRAIRGSARCARGGRCSTGGRPPPATRTGGSRYSRTPLPARRISHVVAYTRQTSALRGTTDTLLDAASYGQPWTCFLLIPLPAWTGLQTPPLSQGGPAARDPGPDFQPISGLVGGSSQLGPGRAGPGRAGPAIIIASFSAPGRNGPSLCRTRRKSLSADRLSHLNVLT